MNKENRIRLLAFMLSLITTMASPVTAFAAEASVVTEGLGATGYSSPLLETVDGDSGETPGDSGNGNTNAGKDEAPNDGGDEVPDNGEDGTPGGGEDIAPGDSGDENLDSGEDESPGTSEGEPPDGGEDEPPCDSEVPDGNEVENPKNDEVEKLSSGEKAAPSVLIATVPIEIPVVMDLEGNVTVPRDAVIINHVEDSGIEVTAIEVSVGADWEIADFSDDFSNKPVNTKEFGLVLRGDELNTNGEVELSADNWQIPADGELPLNMRMQLPRHSEESKTEIATIGFTLSWSDTTDGSDPDSGAEIDPPEVEGKFEVDWDNGVMLPAAKNHALFRWSNQGEDVVLESVESTDDTVASATMSNAQTMASGQASVEVTGNARGTATIIGTLSNGQTVEFDVAISELDAEQEPSVEVDSSLHFYEGDTVSPENISVTIPLVNFDGSKTSITVMPSDIPDISLKTGKNMFSVSVDVGGISVAANAVIVVSNENPSNGLILSETEAKNAGFTFRKSGGKIYITRFYNEQSKTEVNVPEQIGDLKVVGINPDAFANHTELKTITLPDTVYFFGKNAFNGCSSLERILLSDSPSQIPEKLFYGCSSLETFYMPQNVTEIGEDAFSGCPLRTFKYEGTCNEWNQIIRSQVWIDSNLGCVAVCSNGTTPVYSGTYVTMDQASRFLDIKDGIIIDSNGSTGKYVIPSFVGGQLIHGIGEKAFYAGDYTTAMREAVIPDSITEIPELAFAGDFALETVVLHKGITQIGLQAFCDNPRLEKIIFWGTLEEWEAIEKCSPWVSSDTDIVLVCTDGTKTIED